MKLAKCIFPVSSYSHKFVLDSYNLCVCLLFVNLYLVWILSYLLKSGTWCSCLQQMFLKVPFTVSEIIALNLFRYLLCILPTAPSWWVWSSEREGSPSANRARSTFLLSNGGLELQPPSAERWRICRSFWSHTAPSLPVSFPVWLILRRGTMMSFSTSWSRAHTLGSLTNKPCTCSYLQGFLRARLPAKGLAMGKLWSCRVLKGDLKVQNILRNAVLVTIQLCTDIFKLVMLFLTSFWCCTFLKSRHRLMQCREVLGWHPRVPLSVCNQWRSLLPEQSCPPSPSKPKNLHWREGGRKEREILQHNVEKGIGKTCWNWNA